MKSNFVSRIASSAAALVLALGFVACSSNDEPAVTPTPPVGKEPSVTLAVVSTTENSAVVSVEPKNAEACYISYVVKGETEPTAEQVLNSGTEFSAVGGNYRLEELTPETTYVVVAAVRGADNKSASARLELTTQEEVNENLIEMNILLEALYKTNNAARNGNYFVAFGNATELQWDGDAQIVLDLYNQPDEDSLNAILPNGAYEPASDYSPFTYNPSYSYISIVLDGELVQSPLLGTVTVEREGAEYSILFEGSIMTIDAEVSARYKGAIQFVESETSEWEPFTTPQEVTFDSAESRYWGNWFYPFSDDLGLEFFQGEFDEEGNLVKGYHLQLINFYMPKLMDYNVEQVEVANGVYEVTPDRLDYMKTNAQPYTFDRGGVTVVFEQTTYIGSYLTYVDRENGISNIGLITDGTITVSGEGANKRFEFNLVTEEGIAITADYSGDAGIVNWNDNDENQTWTSRPWTSLTEDHVYDWKPESLCYAILMGDYIKPGLDTWMLMIMANNEAYPDGYGDFFTTELLVDMENGFNMPTGTFNIGWQTEPYTMLPGFTNVAGGILFTYYGDLTPDAEGYSTHAAPIAEGTVTIEKVGEEYKFVFDMTDDGGNKITGEWQGAVYAEDVREEMQGGGESGGDHDHDHEHTMQALRVRR